MARMTRAQSDKWNRDVCLRRIAERTSDRKTWEAALRIIDRMPEGEKRSVAYAHFIRAIVDTPLV